MMSRVFWFAVGTGAGVYGTVKARRLVYRLSPEGLSDQAAAVGVGLRALAADVRDGMVTREQELLDQLQPPHSPPAAAREGRGVTARRQAPQGAPAPALAARSHPVRRDIP
jgi:hypothetical protein